MFEELKNEEHKHDDIEISFSEDDNLDVHNYGLINLAEMSKRK